MNLKQIQEAPPRELIYTSPDKGSRKGKEALESWDRHLPKFPKLMEWARQEKLRNNV